MTVEIFYGNKITDQFDVRYINTLLQHFDPFQLCNNENFNDSNDYNSCEDYKLFASSILFGSFSEISEIHKNEKLRSDSRKYDFLIKTVCGLNIPISNEIENKEMKCLDIIQSIKEAFIETIDSTNLRRSPAQVN